MGSSHLCTFSLSELLPSAKHVATGYYTHYPMCKCRDHQRCSFALTQAPAIFQGRKKRVESHLPPLGSRKDTHNSWELFSKFLMTDPGQLVKSRTSLASSVILWLRGSHYHKEAPPHLIVGVSQGSVPLSPCRESHFIPSQGTNCLYASLGGPGNQESWPFRRSTAEFLAVLGGVLGFLG